MVLMVADDRIRVRVPVIPLNCVANSALEYSNNPGISGHQQEHYLYHITTPLANADKFNPKHSSDNNDEGAHHYLPHHLSYRIVQHRFN
jgi:hypothetical protein